MFADLYLGCPESRSLIWITIQKSSLFISLIKGAWNPMRLAPKVSSWLGIIGRDTSNLTLPNNVLQSIGELIEDMWTSGNHSYCFLHCLGSGNWSSNQRVRSSSFHTFLFLSHFTFHYLTFQFTLHLSAFESWILFLWTNAVWSLVEIDQLNTD